MDTETSDSDSITAQLNRIASNLDGADIEDSEIDPTEIERLSDDIRTNVKPETAEFYAGTSLSEHEAEIMALNVHGLRPLTIALVLSLDSPSSMDVETIRDSREDIREKYETAANTYEILDEHISRPENWECPRCEALVNLDDYNTPPQQCPNCGYELFLETGTPK